MQQGRFAPGLQMKCRLEAKVVPGSSETRIVGWLGECLKVKVAAPPEKGKANRALIELLSEKLALDRGAFTIVSGENSQRKVIAIEGITSQQLGKALSAESS